jgi:uncharacterized membrane protein YkvA (DUF1232 family)
MNLPALEFAGEYSAERFHEKLARHAKRAGSQAVEKALWLYYAAEDPQSPKWAKGIILGALGYFIVPFDGIPDLLLGVGYTDDLGVLALALASVAMYITPEAKEKARTKMQVWFPGRAGD